MGIQQVQGQEGETVVVGLICKDSKVLIVTRNPLKDTLCQFQNLILVNCKKLN